MPTHRETTISMADSPLLHRSPDLSSSFPASALEEDKSRPPPLYQSPEVSSSSFSSSPASALESRPFVKVESRHKPMHRETTFSMPPPLLHRPPDPSSPFASLHASKKVFSLFEADIRFDGGEKEEEEHPPPLYRLPEVSSSSSSSVSAFKARPRIEAEIRFGGGEKEEKGR